MMTQECYNNIQKLLTPEKSMEIFLNCWMSKTLYPIIDRTLSESKFFAVVFSSVERLERYLMGELTAVTIPIEFRSLVLEKDHREGMFGIAICTPTPIQLSDEPNALSAHCHILWLELDYWRKEIENLDREFRCTEFSDSFEQVQNSKT
jgi:hypothetical protein